jgi:hypothetical protein
MNFTHGRTRSNFEAPPKSGVPFVGIACLALTACILSAGCSSFSDVRDLQAIQESPGFFPKALYYCGSDDMCHYFEQETPLADLTFYSKRVRTLMVSREEVSLPEGIEYEHWTYRGRKDSRRQMLRLRMTGHHPARGVAEYPPRAYEQY